MISHENHMIFFCDFLCDFSDFSDYFLVVFQ